MPELGKNEFVTVFNEFYKPVKNFIYYKTGDIELADDIAQDVFVKVWEKRGDIRVETIRPLLFTIAGNLCKNRFEHQQVVFEFAGRRREDDFPDSPEFIYELNEFSQKLQKAIAALNEKNRVVFLMNRIDGYTYNKIAENLGLSVKAVEKRMKNALSDLKQKIEYKL